MQTLLRDFVRRFGRAADFSNKAGNLGDALRAFDVELCREVGATQESAAKSGTHDQSPSRRRPTLVAAN